VQAELQSSSALKRSQVLARPRWRSAAAKFALHDADAGSIVEFRVSQKPGPMPVGHSCRNQSSTPILRTVLWWISCYVMALFCVNPGLLHRPRPSFTPNPPSPRSCSLSVPEREAHRVRDLNGQSRIRWPHIRVVNVTLLANQRNTCRMRGTGEQQPEEWGEVPLSSNTINIRTRHNIDFFP
jgi:hypothetical protein